MNKASLEDLTNLIESMKLGWEKKLLENAHLDHMVKICQEQLDFFNEMSDFIQNSYIKRRS